MWGADDMSAYRTIAETELAHKEAYLVGQTILPPGRFDSVPESTGPLRKDRCVPIKKAVDIKGRMDPTNTSMATPNHAKSSYEKWSSSAPKLVEPILPPPAVAPPTEAEVDPNAPPVHHVLPKSYTGSIVFLASTVIPNDDEEFEELINHMFISELAIDPLRIASDLQPGPPIKLQGGWVVESCKYTFTLIPPHPDPQSRCYSLSFSHAKQPKTAEECARIINLDNAKKLKDENDG
jgi:hypothetical protein